MKKLKTCATHFHVSNFFLAVQENRQNYYQNTRQYDRLPPFPITGIQVRRRDYLHNIRNVPICIKIWFWMLFLSRIRFIRFCCNNIIATFFFQYKTSSKGAKKRIRGPHSASELIHPVQKYLVSLLFIRYLIILISIVPP